MKKIVLIVFMLLVFFANSFADQIASADFSGGDEGWIVVNGSSHVQTDPSSGTGNFVHRTSSFWTVAGGMMFSEPEGINQRNTWIISPVINCSAYVDIKAIVSYQHQYGDKAHNECELYVIENKDLGSLTTAGVDSWLSSFGGSGINLNADENSTELGVTASNFDPKNFIEQTTAPLSIAADGKQIRIAIRVYTTSDPSNYRRYAFKGISVTGESLNGKNLISTTDFSSGSQGWSEYRMSSHASSFGWTYRASNYFNVTPGSWQGGDFDKINIKNTFLVSPVMDLSDFKDIDLYLKYGFRYGNASQSKCVLRVQEVDSLNLSLSNQAAFIAQWGSFEIDLNYDVNAGLGMTASYTVNANPLETSVAQSLAQFKGKRVRLAFHLYNDAVGNSIHRTYYMKMVRLTGLPYQAPSLSAVTFDPNPALVATPTEVCISVVSSTETASSVVLKWGTLSGNLNSSLAMSNTSGNTWCATIPGQVAGNYLYQIDASIDGKVLTTGEVAYEVGDYAYSTPYGVYKSDESGSSFTMTWNRVSLSDGYKIRYRTFVGAVHGAWTTIDVGDVTTFEITSGLVSSSFYEIQIQAYGSSGVSAWSALATTFFGLGMPVPFSKLPIIFLFLLIITAVIIRKRVI